MASILKRLATSTLTQSSGLFRESWIDTFSSPERVEPAIRLLRTQAPRSAVPFALRCRTQQDNWDVHGLRILKDESSSCTDNIIVVSGHRGEERKTIGVNLRLASMLVENQCKAAVSIIPNANPLEHLRAQQRDELMEQSRKIEALAHNFSTNLRKSSSERVPLDITQGVLKYYIKRFGDVFSFWELNFSPTGATLVHKRNSRLTASSEEPLFNFPSSPELNSPPPKIHRENPAEKSSKTYVIELRDEHGYLSEGTYAERADQVSIALHKLLDRN